MAYNSIREWVANYRMHVIPQKAAGITAKAQFYLTGDQGGEWSLMIQNQDVQIVEGRVEKPNVTITTDSQMMLKVLTGKQNGSIAFLQGKMKVSGDIPLAIRLLSLFRP